MAILSFFFVVRNSSRAAGALIEKADEDAEWTVAQWIGFIIFGVLGTLALTAMAGLCVLLCIAYGMANL